jgi:LuxR family maltose regulon positive regulatory protein
VSTIGGNTSTTEPLRRAARARPVLSPVHRAKLRRPSTVEHFVRRDRLHEFLDDIARGPITLVIAPAGSGKTSLIAGWVGEQSLPSAWVSLDDADLVAVQFWSAMIAAVDSIAPGSGAAALAVLERPGGRTIEVVDELLAGLEARHGTEALLVVDDFHVVDRDDVVTKSFERLLLHLPRWLHVIVTSRRELTLPIDRMRSRGHVAEIRFAELRFSSDEAVQLLTRLSPSMPQEHVDLAVTRAAGWATSLQLAALATRSAQAQRDLGAIGRSGELLVHDYVLHEILSDESAETMDVLFAAALVPRLNAELGAALTGRNDAGEILRRAERRGLFVTRLGPDGWFELHDLVREVLIAELSRRSPADLAALHGRAAEWFESSGDVVRALEQWQRAGRPMDALRLLVANQAALYDIGREAVIAGTIAAIHSDVTTGDPAAKVALAWCHMFVDRRRFLELVEELVWWVDQSDPDTVVRARVTALRSIAAVIRGDWSSSATLARSAMEQLGDGWRNDFLGRFSWNMIVRSTALSESWDDSDDVVRRAEAELSLDPERRLSLEGTRSLGAALAGRPLDALRVAAGVRHAAEVSNMSVLRFDLALAEALAHRELGDRARALSDLESLVAAPVVSMLYCRVLAMVELGHAHLEGGDVAAAWSMFADARTLVDTESFERDVQGWPARLGVLLALADDDLASARQWAAEIDDQFWSGIASARIHLAEGDREAATDALDVVVPRCVRHRVIVALLRAQAAGDRAEAAKWSTTAIELAADYGLLQTVAAEGRRTLELVERASWRVPVEWMDRLRRAVAEPPSRSMAHRAGLVEPLTERERDVLRFLPSRLTVREIAEELHVSVNTLKFHLKVIYRKLGVTSRAEAAELAREMTSLRK